MAEPPSTQYLVPIQETVRDLLAGLLGRGVAVSKATTSAQPTDGLAVAGEYVNDDGQLVAVAVGDLGFANRTGAALSMVPATMSDEGVANNELTEALRENTQEVLNIMASLLNSSSTPHMKLRCMHLLPADAAPEALELVASAKVRRDFDVTIEGYGDGKLSLYFA